MDWFKNFSFVGGKCGSSGTTQYSDDSDEEDDKESRFGDRIQIAIIKLQSGQKKNPFLPPYGLLTTQIPKPLEKYNYSITVNGHKVKFSSYTQTGMARGGTFYINTLPGEPTGEGYMSQSLLDYCYNDIKDMIKSLNQMMEIDEQRGVRFGKDEKWINSVKEGSKFEFPDETDTMYIE